MAETWEGLIEAGHLGQAIRLFGDIRKSRQLLADEGVAECEVLDDISSSDLALERARLLLKRSDLRKENAARCWAVVGSQHFRISRLEEGKAAFETARALAAESRNRVSAAVVQGSWLRSLASWVGPDAAASEVATTKAMVSPLGRSALTIRLRLTLAEIELKRGAIRQGARQLETAGGMLRRFNNVALNADYLLKSGIVSLLSSDLLTADKRCREALSLAQACESASLEVVARTNLGHILMRLGHSSEALSQLKTALKLCRSGGGAELGIRDGLSIYQLEFGTEAGSEKAMREAWELSASLNDGHSYYGLWHILTRLKWLLTTNRAAEALTLAEATLPRVDRLADRNLLQRMQMITAEILGACGRPLDGAALLAAVHRANPDASLEMVAEASRVAGALAVDDPVASRTHFERAIRVFHAIGQRTACAMARRQAGFGQADTAGRPAALTPARVIERAAAMSHLAAHPPLVGIEALDLIADARVCTHAALIEHDGTGLRRTLAARPSGHAVPEAVSPYGTDIPLGALGARTYELRVEPTTGPAARTTLAAVERLAHASVTLSQLRTEAREQVTAWTDQSPEEQLGLVYASEAMQELVKMTRRIAPTNVTVLITGETGAGKEVFARALHQASHRRDQAFLPYNCTTVPRDMLDSQLFGFRRGAFTGATEEYAGLIRGAAGGTLFLDEIGEMPLDVQPKILRFLESGEVLPLGESRPVHVDVRIIAATNADLDQLVNEGRFREDLYYRLNVVRLRVPPLRDRREEVPLLVQSLLERIARESQVEPVRVSDEAMEHLALYHWPGNARQLANELRRLSALADPGSVIMPEHLSPEIAVMRPPAAAQGRAAELLVRTDQPLSSATEHVERVLIAQAIDACHGNLERAAQQLGLSRKGLFLKRQRLGLL